MRVFEKIKKNCHENIDFFYDKDTNLKLIFAVHKERNGVTFGGLRLLRSVSEKDALKDALRLSEAMSYKLSMINEPFGGSKAVVILDKKTRKDKKILKKISKIIQKLDGKLITSIDYGFEKEDADYMRKFTKYVFATPNSKYGLSGSTTAKGIFLGIKTCLKERYGNDIIKGKKFAIQGVGNVGGVLADILISEGGIVFISDKNRNNLKRFMKKAQIIKPEEILKLKVDVLCPCGPAYILNKNSIPKINAKIIAGGANCQLEDEEKDDKLLKKRNILFAPDFIINSGGVMQGIAEYNKKSLQSAIDRLPIIPKNLEKIIRISDKNNAGTMKTAKILAKKRL